MGGFLPYILLVFIPSIAITGWAAWRVRSTYAKWSKVDSGIHLSAFDFARRLLDRQGLTDVRIEPVPGQLTDHYDPRGKVLRVSSTVAGKPELGNYDPTNQMLGVPASPGLSGGRGRGHRPRGGARAAGSRARSVDERAPGDRAGGADRLQHRPVADHRRR